MGLFESALEELAEWRHQDIFRRLPAEVGRPTTATTAFMSPEKAAVVMGVSVPEVMELAGRGYLEIDFEKKLIRPAVVSVLGVRTR